MTETFHEFEAAAYLTSPETTAQFMTDALETADAAYVAKAVDVVKRARNRRAYPVIPPVCATAAAPTPRR